MNPMNSSHMYMHVCTCMYVRMYICMYVCMYHMYVYIYTHMTEAFQAVPWKPGAALAAAKAKNSFSAEATRTPPIPA